jgi:PAS domain S-box-containing protein
VAGAREDLREGTGVDGVRRLYATVPVEATFDAGLYLGLGIDSQEAFAEGDRILWQYLRLLAAVLVAAIIAGIIGGRTFVSGPEKALKLADERMRFVLSVSGVGIWELDLRTQLSQWSETCEAMHGIAPGKFGGTFESFLDCIHVDDRDAVRQSIAASIATRTNSSLEYRTVWPDGTVRRISSSGNFFYDEAGQPIRGAGVATDVTQRRLLEEQLRQSMKMEAVGQLAGGIAHDFNNLLTIITGNTELALGAVPQESEVSEDLRHSLAAANRAAQLTKQLLAFSRKQVLRPEPVDVNEVVEELTPLVRRLVGADITVECARDGGTLITMVDRAQLEEAIINLAVNAREAMPSGGTVRLATDNVRLDAVHIARKRLELEPGSYVMLSVSDTGTGMDAAALARAFEPFFTTKTVAKGSGLRLPSVYGMVKQFGGQTSIESELGRGTTVTMLLPRVDDGVPNTATHPAGPAAMEPVLVSAL